MDQQSNHYYYQQLYQAHSNSYPSNANSYAQQSQQQLQQQSEPQSTESMRAYQFSTLQPYPAQPYSPETQALHQTRPETQSNFTQSAIPHTHIHPPHSYSSSEQQQQYPLRDVHSQPTLQRNPSMTSTAYDFDPSSQSGRSSSSDSSATYSDPMPSYRDEYYGQHATHLSPQAASSSADYYASASIPRLPPIFQVERQQVTTTATQTASANRRRNDANFRCPVPGCGSTFTRRFNLKGHLRSHTSERPFACEWPGCDKAFARQHDCKRHYQLHSTNSGTYLCQGCGKSFSRTDALSRHLRSEAGFECRPIHYSLTGGEDSLRASPQGDSPSPGEMTDGETASETYN